MATYDAHMSEARPGNLPLRMQNCSIERTLGVVGEKWTFLVLREAFAGVRRFDDMQLATGAPRQVLSARLSRLVEAGLLRKVPYREPGQRQRDEYRLTQMGLDLYPIMVALMYWGDRYLSDDDGPPVLLTHRGCGAPVEQHFRCAEGHGISGPQEVTPFAGPGLRPLPGSGAASGAAGSGQAASRAAGSGEAPPGKAPSGEVASGEVASGKGRAG